MLTNWVLGNLGTKDKLMHSVKHYRLQVISLSCIDVLLKFMNKHIELYFKNWEFIECYICKAKYNKDVF